MTEPSFDPGGFFQFDLAKGSVRSRGGSRVLLVSESVLSPLINTAVANGDLTAVRSLGSQLGTLIASVARLAGERAVAEPGDRPRRHGDVAVRLGPAAPGAVGRRARAAGRRPAAARRRQPRGRGAARRDVLDTVLDRGRVRAAQPQLALHHGRPAHRRADLGVVQGRRELGVDQLESSRRRNDEQPDRTPGSAARTRAGKPPAAARVRRLRRRWRVTRRRQPACQRRAGASAAPPPDRRADTRRARRRAHPSRARSPQPRRSRWRSRPNRIARAPIAGAGRRARRRSGAAGAVRACVRRERARRARHAAGATSARSR